MKRESYDDRGRNQKKSDLRSHKRVIQRIHMIHVYILLYIYIILTYMTSHNMYVVDIYFIIMYIYIYILKRIYMYTTTTTSGYCIASSSRIHNFIH